MRAREFITPLKQSTILREYKRDITLRQYGNGILNAWKTGEGTGYFKEFTVLGLDDDEATDENIVNRIIGKMEYSDPTPNKIYTPWLAREYANGNIKRIEDLSGYTPLLSDYNRYKNRGDFPKEAKDIMRLNANARWRPDSIWGVLHAYTPPEREDDKNKGNSTVVYEDDSVRVIRPLDEAAACYYGRGTRWCTAATRSTNYFDSYNKDGPLYILLPKKPEHEGQKFQMHFPSSQFMDENDNPVAIDELLRKRFPQLVPVFEKLGESVNQYIPLLSDKELLNLYQVGAKLIVDNITERLVDSGYREIPLQYFKDQAQFWFFDSGATARGVRTVLSQMANSGDEVDLYYRFPRLFKHILVNTAYDYETHNRRNPHDKWELYITDDDAARIGRWIESSIKVVLTEIEIENVKQSIQQVMPVDGTPFSYILLPSTPQYIK